MCSMWPMIILLINYHLAFYDSTNKYEYAECSMHNHRSLI